MNAQVIRLRIVIAKHLYSDRFTEITKIRSFGIIISEILKQYI